MLEIQRSRPFFSPWGSVHSHALWQCNARHKGLTAARTRSSKYQRQYDEHEVHHETQRRIAEVEARREMLTAKHGKLKGYLDVLRCQGQIKTFNETLWCGTIEQVQILHDGTMRFIFKDGAVVEG